MGRPGTELLRDPRVETVGSKDSEVPSPSDPWVVLLQPLLSFRPALTLLRSYWWGDRGRRLPRSRTRDRDGCGGGPSYPSDRPISGRVWGVGSRRGVSKSGPRRKQGVWTSSLERIGRHLRDQINS